MLNFQVDAERSYHQNALAILEKLHAEVFTMLLGSVRVLIFLFLFFVSCKDENVKINGVLEVLIY